MVFSLFVVVLALIVLAVTYFHSTQGFFSAAISAILCAFAALLALGYHETVVEMFLAGSDVADIAHGAVVLILFAVIYMVCRLVFDKMIPDNVALPSGADKGGAIAMGLVAGVFAAGLCAFAAQSLPFGPALMGYARFRVEPERDATIPQADGQRSQNRFLWDALETDQPLHLADAERQSSMLPADDILLDTLYRVSDRGALAANPVSEVHPDWLTELFGQRLGIQSAGKRTATNVGGRVDVIAGKDDAQPDAGVYLLDRQLKQKTHDFKEIAKAGLDPTFPKSDPKTDPSRVVVVLRAYFGAKAKDAKDSIVRFSPSSVRLVTQKKGGEGELVWANYFPVGTIEDAAEFYYNRADDFMFIQEQGGVDLVFQVEREGFVTGVGPNFDLSNAKIADGTFVEVKRVGRVALGGLPVQSFAKLKKNPAIAVLRKPLVKTPPKVAPPAPTDGTPAEGAPPAESPPAEGAPSAPAGMAAKLPGTWETVGQGGTSSFTFTDKTVDYQARGLKGNVAWSGTWQSAGGEGTALTIAVTPKAAEGAESSGEPEQYNLAFTGDDQFAISGGKVGETPVTYKRKGGAAESPAAPAAAGNPAAAKPAPAKPAPAAAGKKDTSLVLADPQESRKFYAPITVPKGSSGEVPAGGGTVTVEGDTLRVITLPPVNSDSLRTGQGEPLNRLAVPEGSVMFQVEATPGPDGGGWAWKDRVGEIAAIDGTGARRPAVGVWALVNGGADVVARFNVDGGASLSDYAPTGPATKIVLAFAVPEGQQVKQVMIGDAVLRAYAAP